MKDKIFLLGCFLFVGVLYFLKARSTLDLDFGWHLRMGQLILERGIPQTDPFSYTMQYYPVIGHEWSIDALFAFMYPHVGLQGLAMVFAFLGLAVMGIHYCAIKKEITKWSLLPFLLSALSLLLLLGIRPQIISWLFFSVVALIVVDERTWKKFRWFLPFIMLLWVNLHGSFPLGILVIILKMIVQGFRGKFEVQNSKHETSSNDKKTKYKNVLHLKNLYFGIVSNFDIRISDLIIVALCLLATIINPYSWRIWWEVWMTMSDTKIRWIITEWHSAILFLNVSFVFLLSLSLALIFRYRKKFTPLELILYVLLLWQGIGSVRHLPFWILFALPMNVRGMNYFLREIRDIPFAQKRFSLAYKIFFVIFMLVFVFDTLGDPMFFDSGFATYPVKAVQFLKKHPSEGALFSEYNWGGYLVWQYPEKKVFIDGRMPSWREEEAPLGQSTYAFQEWQTIMEGKSHIHDVLEKYHIDTVMLSTKEDDTTSPWVQQAVKKIIPTSFYMREILGRQLQAQGMKQIYHDDLVVIYRKK